MDCGFQMLFCGHFGFVAGNLVVLTARGVLVVARCASLLGWPVCGWAGGRFVRCVSSVCRVVVVGCSPCCRAGVRLVRCVSSRAACVPVCVVSFSGLFGPVSWAPGGNQDAMEALGNS